MKTKGSGQGACSKTNRTWKKNQGTLFFFFFLFPHFCFQEGKLGPIFKVPCINKFLFWHYCLFCTRTQILSIIWWSTGNNFVLPWPLALALSLMIKQKSIENDTNPLGVGGSSRGTSKAREFEIFFKSRIWNFFLLRCFRLKSTVPKPQSCSGGTLFF